MGLYDTVGPKGIQVKATPNPGLIHYCIGDKIPLTDGLYIGREGAFIVQDSKVMAAADRAFTKWNDPLDFEKIIEPHDYIKTAVEAQVKRMAKKGAKKARKNDSYLIRRAFENGAKGGPIK